MNYAEMGAVLAKAAIFDYRTVDEMDVMAWHEVCGDLDFNDAMTGVSRWYRDRSDRLMPSHLREAATLVRSDRRRDARLRAEQERAANTPERPPAVPLSSMPAEIQAAIRRRPSGPLSPVIQQLVAERFDPHNDRPVNPPNVLDAVYGDERQDSEGD